jgi:hypothetical protein
MLNNENLSLSANSNADATYRVTFDLSALEGFSNEELISSLSEIQVRYLEFSLKEDAIFEKALAHSFLLSKLIESLKNG